MKWFVRTLEIALILLCNSSWVHHFFTSIVYKASLNAVPWALGLASPAGIVIIFWMEHQLSLRLWRMKLCKIGTVELKLIELPSGFLEITFPKTNLLRFVVILPYASLGLSKIDFSTVFGKTLFLFRRYLSFAVQTMESSIGHTRNDGRKFFIY